MKPVVCLSSQLEDKKKLFNALLTANLAAHLKRFNKAEATCSQSNKQEMNVVLLK